MPKLPALLHMHMLEVRLLFEFSHEEVFLERLLDVCSKL